MIMGIIVCIDFKIRSGSGFASKNYYGSGFFQMRIKLFENNSFGVVTAFYVRLCPLLSHIVILHEFVRILNIDENLVFFIFVNLVIADFQRRHP